MTWKTLTLSAAAVAIAICFGQGNASMAVEQEAEKDIVETAVASGKFKTRAQRRKSLFSPMPQSLTAPARRRSGTSPS